MIFYKLAIPVTLEPLKDDRNSAYAHSFECHSGLDPESRVVIFIAVIADRP